MAERKHAAIASLPAERHWQLLTRSMRVRREELEEGKSDAALDLERQGAEGLELVEAASVLALLV